MFTDQDRRRELRRNIRKLEGPRVAATLVLMSTSLSEEDRPKVQREFERMSRTLERLESALLIETARHLGIEVPSHREKPDWWDDDIDDPEVYGMIPEYAINRWLSYTGKLMVGETS